MEASRYKSNPILYITSIISMLLSLVVFLFAFYLIPYLLIGLQYDVPEFISHISHWFEIHFALKPFVSGILIFCILILLGIIFGLISKLTSVNIENRVLHIRDESLTHKDSDPIGNEDRALWKSLKFIIQLAGLILIVFIVLKIIEFVLYVPPHNTEISHGIFQALKNKAYS